MKRTWRLTLEYDGSRYSGSQEQANARTVMGDLRKAIGRALPGPIELQGAGRTDAGVHALAQVAHVRSAGGTSQPNELLLRKTNEALPADIAVLEWADAPPSFHARHDALSRRYIYQIATRKMAFSKRYVWWIKQPLDIPRMNEGAKSLIGRHDFAAFRAADPARESTIVVVESAEVEVKDDLVVFQIEASHFLWRMVRRLTGVLVKLGQGEVSESDLESLLADQAPSSLDVAAWTAPASGLFLESVRYREGFRGQKKRSIRRK